MIEKMSDEERSVHKNDEANGNSPDGKELNNAGREIDNEERDRDEERERDRAGGRRRNSESERDDDRGRERGARDGGRGDRSDERSRSRTRRGRGGGEQMTTSLLVRNLSFHVRGDELKRLFSKHGEVRDVYIPEVK